MRNKKRFIVSKLAAIVRHAATERLFAERYKRYRREYGAKRHFLSEFNKFCIHRNLPSFVRAKSDYQLARFVKSAQRFMGFAGISHTEFSLFSYSDRDALIKWFYKQDYHRDLPHITEIDDFDTRNEIINSADCAPECTKWFLDGVQKRKVKRKANQEKNKQRKANKK